QKKLDVAQDRLRKRKELLGDSDEAKNLVDPDELDKVLTKVELTDAQVNELCVHPRLHLFVGADSPHPAEKFGCTSCHSGQGSSTSFVLASHTPNNSKEKKRWADSEKHGGQD